MTYFDTSNTKSVQEFFFGYFINRYENKTIIDNTEIVKDQFKQFFELPSNSGSYEYIYQLNSQRLRLPIIIQIEFDETIYIANCLDLPIYAHGKTQKKAKQNLIKELEILLSELIDDENLSSEWIKHKNYLIESIGINEQQSIQNQRG